MKLVLLSIALLALCVFGMCFNIIFRRNGKFPDGEIAHNKALREQGIRCAKMEEKQIWGNGKGSKGGKIVNQNDISCEDCSIDCSLSREVKDMIRSKGTCKKDN